MAKRETEIEPLDEVTVEQDAPTVGQQLRAAREQRKVALDDIAAQTRIPKRHLESLENSEWDQLPAPTYTLGFAKSYASAVGLDRTEIGDQLRAEMGGQRFTANTTEPFEPADPRRTMPKSLVIGTIVAVIVLIALMSWLNNRSLETTDETGNVTAEQAAAPTAATPVGRAAAPAQNLPVVINATDAVWLQVYEKGGATFFSGILQPGQTFAVPSTSAAPLLKTAKPEALRISVGNQVALPVGKAAEKVSDVSLLSADLLKGSAAAASVPQRPTPAAPQSPRAPRRTRATAPGARSAPAPEAAPGTDTAPTTNIGE
jgi:cytoskeleton protein RodZ